VTADASDNVGVTRVELRVDGAVVATDTSAPYAWTWNSTTVPDGAHALSTAAYDAAGNVTVSADVNVTVQNADSIPPTAPANLVATPAKRKVMLTWTASTDNVAVTGYQVWRATAAGGPFALIATVTSTSYTNTGLTSGTTYYYEIVATDAAGNASASSNVASARAR